MKQCPECQRTYGDDLNFCLEDGSVLRAYQDDEVTVISPKPTPTPPLPPPTPPPITPQPQGKKWAVLGVIGTIALILLLSGIKLAIWIANQQDRQDRATVSSNPSTPSYSFSPSPSSSAVPLCVVLGNCPSPSPTTSPQLNSSSPSPSASPVEPAAPTLRTGTYQGEFSSPINEDGIQAARTLKIQFTFNADGTYSGQGFATIPSTDTTDRLFLEEKGYYSVANDVLTLRGRLQRKYDFEDDSWLPWTPAKDSTLDNKLRSVSPTTFQMYMNSPPSWVTFSRL
ncbi:MAG TPA: hypothetical protein VN643_04540 [Pyrinomonadaceae bacterium]|nr:hypothetical protein [Pyrinomonadaceae bacterium]